MELQNLTGASGGNFAVLAVILRALLICEIFFCNVNVSQELIHDS